MSSKKTRLLQREEQKKKETVKGKVGCLILVVVVVGTDIFP